MNYFNAYFNPMDAITQGYDLGDKFTRTQREALAMRDDEAMRDAYGQMGQGEQMTGYDDVPEAKRPDFLKRLFASNPRAAMEMEQSLAAPYALKRDIAKAGQIEAAKKESDTKSQLIQQWALGELDPSAVANLQASGLLPRSAQGQAMTDAGGGGQANAFINYLRGSSPDTEEVSVGGMPGGPWRPPEPGGTNALNTALLPQPNLSRLSVRERSRTIGPNGISITSKTPSELDVAGKVADIKSKEGTLGVAERNLTRQEQADKAEQEHKQREYNRQLARDRDEEVNRITEHIRQNKQAIRDANKLPPDQAEQEVAALKTENRQLEQRRNGLLKGTIKPEAKTTQAAPAAIPQAPSIMPSRSAPASPAAPTASAPVQATTPAPIQAAPAETPISKDQEMQTEQKRRDLNIQLATKDIDASRDDARRVLQYGSDIEQLAKMALSGTYGSKIARIPGGEMALRALSNNDNDFQKKHDAITNLFAKPGQSQLMNTIVERQMVSAAVPSLDASPDANKKSAANLLNYYHFVKTEPTFLEQWSKTHNGTLSGAADAWADYVEHNKPYTFEEDRRGTVKVSGRRAVLPPEKWMEYRQRGAVDVWTDKQGVRHIWLKEPNGEIYQYEGAAGKKADE